MPWAFFVLKPCVRIVMQNANVTAMWAETTEFGMGAAQGIARTNPGDREIVSYSDVVARRSCG